MIQIDTLPSFLLASLLLCIAPGPDNIFVLTLSSIHGTAKGLMVTLGLCSGLVIHTTIVSLGMAAIIQTWDYALLAIQLFGGAYLVYLSIIAYRAASQGHSGENHSAPDLFMLYRRGLIMNLSNPKILLFFLAFLPQFAHRPTGEIGTELFTLGLVFALIALLTFGLIAVTAGRVGFWMREIPTIELYLNRLAAAVFLVLALSLLWNI